MSEIKKKIRRVLRKTILISFILISSNDWIFLTGNFFHESVLKNIFKTVFKETVNNAFFNDLFKYLPSS